MALDFTADPFPAPRQPVAPAAAWRGQGNYHKGLAAEALVRRHYLQKGHRLAAERWRGGGGEIDLIFDDGATHVFVEVKASSSHERAADLITDGQVRRLFRAADAYLGARYGHSDVDCRFDLAFVDRFGRIALEENALILW